MIDENFYREFKQVYQAVNIIGKEVMKLKEKIEVIDSNVNEIKQKLESYSQKISEKEEDPERKAALDKYVRSRTGDFKPGDEEIDVNNVFYAGSRKRV